MQSLAALERLDLDEDGDAVDGGARVAREAAARFERAACGEQVIDDEDLLSGLDGVGVDLDAVGAVFEGIGEAARRTREFARFADGDEPGGEGLGEGGAENEPA